MQAAPAHAPTPTPVHTDDEFGRPQPGTAKWLAFTAPPWRYLFALEHVGEVLPAREISAVPFTQPWFCGATNVRGVLHGVVDLSLFLSLYKARSAETRHPTRQPALYAETRSEHLVTISASMNWPCALLAGSLQGLRNPTDFPSVTQDGAGDSSLLIAIRHDPAGAQWLELDLPAVVMSMRSQGIQARPKNL